MKRLRALLRWLGLSKRPTVVAINGEYYDEPHVDTTVDLRRLGVKMPRKES